jgi:hypothetical protein
MRLNYRGAAAPLTPRALRASGCGGLGAGADASKRVSGCGQAGLGAADAAGLGAAGLGAADAAYANLITN